MPSPFSEEQHETYNSFRTLADNFTVKFDTRKTGLMEHESSDIPRIFDRVDDIYADNVERIMDYKELQVLAALAVIHGAEFEAVGNGSAGERGV